MKLLLLVVVAFLFIGCGSKQPDIIKTKYKQRECPVPKNKPVFKEYETVILKINAEEFYALQKSEAVKMSTNWISYKSWAEANYELMLNSAKDLNTTK